MSTRKKQLEDLKKHAVTQRSVSILVRPDENVDVTFNTFYGEQKFRAYLPPEFPAKPPVCKMLTTATHHLIRSDGTINNAVLAKWDAKTTLFTVINSICQDFSFHPPIPVTNASAPAPSGAPSYSSFAYPNAYMSSVSASYQMPPPSSGASGSLQPPTGQWQQQQQQRSASPSPAPSPSYVPPVVPPRTTLTTTATTPASAANAPSPYAFNSSTPNNNNNNAGSLASPSQPQSQQAQAASSSSTVKVDNASLKALTLDEMADLDSESDLIAGFVRAQQPLRDRSAQRAALFRDLTNACEKNVQLGEETATLVTSLQAKRSEFEKKQAELAVLTASFEAVKQRYHPGLLYQQLQTKLDEVDAEAYTLLARIRRDADDASGDDESDAKSPMKQQDGGEADPEARDNNNNNNNADSSKTRNVNRFLRAYFALQTRHHLIAARMERMRGQPQQQQQPRAYQQG